MKKRQSAFTLIELMLVIAIMAILATVLVSSIRSIRRQADATLCQSHLRNLHQGVMNFFADHECYPYAGSYEYRDELYSPPRYYQHVGWIGWIRNEEVEEDESSKSKARNFKYVGCGLADSSDDVRESIRQGSLFDYVRSDYSCYFCKQFHDGKGKARRTYVMNNYFGSRTIPRRGAITTRELSIQRKEASRLALFVELAGTSGASGVSGFTGNEGDFASDNLADDSSWDWQSGDGRSYGENYAGWHKKGKDQFGHVIFLDGHVESVLKNDKIREKSEMLGRGGVE